ncbi:MAG: oxidoreductase [Propionibacterium sp.]|nr:oxidoreductase [Propionibacterium sp.]
MIVGAGQAGISCAMALRRGGWEGPVTLVGREPHFPYERPPLSKRVLIAEVGPESLILADDDALAKLEVEFVQAEVVAIDREHRRVRLSDGSERDYGHLVLATGGNPRYLPAALPGADTPGVHVIRTIDDAVAVAHRLETVRDVVVIGGGFIGVEAAAALASAGRNVAVLEAVPSLLARVAPVELGEWATSYLERHGVTVRTSTMAASIDTDDDGRLSGVTATDGARYPAGLVIVGIGAVPEVALAESAGLRVERAIVVDDDLRTDDPAIFAVGDCAVQVRADGTQHRLESVQAAQDQGRHVAGVLLGTSVAGYREVPWFWSDVGEARIQMAGRIDLATDVILRGDVADDDFSLFGFDGDTFVGVATVNRSRDYLAGRMFLRSGRELQRSTAADEAVDLRALARRPVDPAR